MPAYHSNLNDIQTRQVSNMAILPFAKQDPLNKQTKEVSNTEDIIDEALGLHRANSFFKNFDVKGPADRVLIYLTLYIQECLLKLSKLPSKV
jgi:actin related protein 2/3 complex subunit 3